MDSTNSLDNYETTNVNDEDDEIELFEDVLSCFPQKDNELSDDDSIDEYVADDKLEDYFNNFHEINAPLGSNLLTELEIEEKKVIMNNKIINSKMGEHKWYWSKLESYLKRHSEPTLEYSNLMAATKQHYRLEHHQLERDRLFWWKKCQAIKKRKQDLDGKIHTCSCCLGKDQFRFEHSNVYKKFLKDREQL